jgi:Tol biopolymer transport system component
VTRLAAALCVIGALAAGCGGHGQHGVGNRIAAPSQRASTIAALKLRFGNPPHFELITFTDSGSEVRSLVQVPAKGVERLSGPVWSPDAKRIYAVGSGPEKHGKDFVYYESDLYSLPAEGGELQRLTTSGDIGAVAPSPDGRQLVVAREDFTQGFFDVTSQLWLMSSEGKDARPLLDSEKGRLDIPGSWSPDGKSIAFTRCKVAAPDSRGRTENSCGIYVVSPDGSGLRKLADRSSAPAFSADGTRIAFVSDRDENGIHQTGEDEEDFANELYVMDADGSSPRRLTTSPELDESSPTWSPDGDWIAYAREGPASFVEQVMLTNGDGSCSRVLIGDARHEADPLLSYGSPAWRPGRVAGRQTATCG